MPQAPHNPQRASHFAQPESSDQAQERTPRSVVPAQGSASRSAAQASNSRRTTQVSTQDNSSSFVEEAAPRPIGVDPALTGSFSKLSAGEGAVISTRDNAADTNEVAKKSAQGKRLRAHVAANAHTPVELDETEKRRFYPIIAAAAVVVLALLGFFVSRALRSGEPNPADEILVPEATSQEERIEAGASDEISYEGYHYAIRTAPDGLDTLVRIPDAGGEPLTLLQLMGDPVALTLYDGALIIPENLPNGSWDIMAYSMADGSEASQLMSADGAAVAGQGSIESARLDGTELVLSFADGSEQRVALAW